MMNKKIIRIVLLIVLVVCSLVFDIFVYKKYKTEYIETYVASHQISQRTKIKMEDLETIMVPKEYLQNNVYTSTDEILDKYVKLGYSIPKGSLFYKSSLETDIKDLANTLLLKDEVNYDLVVGDIKINTANLSVNMYIDLYLTINHNGILASDLFISNARITGLYDNNNKPILDYDKDSRVSIISIAINSNCVNYLNKARMIGEISSVINYNTYETFKKCELNDNSILLEYLE